MDWCGKADPAAIGMYWRQFLMVPVSVNHQGSDTSYIKPAGYRCGAVIHLHTVWVDRPCLIQTNHRKGVWLGRYASEEISLMSVRASSTQSELVCGPKREMRAFETASDGAVWQEIVAS